MGLFSAVTLTAAVGAATAASPGVKGVGRWDTTWAHGWDTAGAAWWGDFGYTLLNQAQAEFVASEYKVVSLEKCTGSRQGVKTEIGIYQTAAQLKKINPNIKVMFYWSTSQAGIGCYDNNATFMNHPEWWLRDDSGKVIRSGGDQGGPRMDWTNPAAVAWWLSVPLAGDVQFGGNVTSTMAAQLIDGVLADDAGYNTFANVSPAREEELANAKLAMLETLQTKFDDANGGVVFGNGLSEYDQNPEDPHNRRIVARMGGVQNEHYAVFEQVNRSTGALLLDKAADALTEMEWAGQNASKQVFCSFWAGPYISPLHFAPGDPNNKDPTGTPAQQMQAWRNQLLKYLPFNLASFLLIAGENSWFSQAVWYELHQGFVPCPDDPDSCSGPSPWYPLLSKPLGAPLGPRTQLGDYRWQRKFEHATVTVDLNQPLDGSGITFHTA